MVSDTHEHNRFEDAGLLLLGDQADIDVRRDLEVVPLRFVHRLRVGDETNDGADLRAAGSCISDESTSCRRKCGNTYVP